jgi:hypothetical protein
MSATNKANAFDVLKEVSRRNMGIKLFRSDCITQVDKGKKGVGWIKFAIDSNTAEDIMGRMLRGDALMVNLLIVDPDDFHTVRQEMENEP